MVSCCATTEEIARLIYACAGAGILAKNLILRSGLNAGDERWGDTDPQK